MEVSDNILNQLNGVNNNMDMVISILQKVYSQGNNQDLKRAITLLSSDRVSLTTAIVGVAENIPSANKSQNIETARRIAGATKEQDIALLQSLNPIQEQEKETDFRIV